MSKSFSRPSDKALGLRNGWAAGKSASRILAAIGHPGYGEAFARRVLAHMAATGCSAHQAV